jgi:sulfhydrogenase subunit beta (sulfur reductase)
MTVMVMERNGMSYIYIEKEKCYKWISFLVQTYHVYAPVEKENRFVFRQIENSGPYSADMIRLDYTTTILPPKKIIMSQVQDLLHFQGETVKACVPEEERILLGVHPYDITAINQLDILFSENNEDIYWKTAREQTIVIGTNVVHHFKTAFFGSMDSAFPSRGYDIYLTDINDGYVAHVLTSRGENLLKGYEKPLATDQQIRKAHKVNKDAAAGCPEKIPPVPGQNVLDLIARTLQEKDDTGFWEAQAERCFSCATCNLVCPTCYCFDVQDEWDFHDGSARRFRRWDACMTREFAEVTNLDGKHNFRPQKAERYRHRIMRKLSYLNKKLGGPACVGCGRCVTGCTAHIADPLDTIYHVLGRERQKNAD